MSGSGKAGKRGERECIERTVELVGEVETSVRGMSDA